MQTYPLNMDATAALTKATQLITLASNAGASAEEARTAAFLAAKLIAQHGLVLVSKAPAYKAPPAYKSSAPHYKPAAKPTPKPAPKPAYVVVKSSLFCACKKCGKTIKAGEPASVSQANVWNMKGARHVACA